MDTFTFKLNLNTEEQKMYNDLYEREFDLEYGDDRDFGINGNIIDRYKKLYKFWISRIDRDKTEPKKVEYILLRLSCIELELKTMGLWKVVSNLVGDQIEEKDLEDFEKYLR